MEQNTAERTLETEINTKNREQGRGEGASSVDMYVQQGGGGGDSSVDMYSKVYIVTTHHVKMSPRGQTAGGKRGTGQLAEAARSTCGLWLPGSGRKRKEWTPRVHGCCGMWQGSRRGSPLGGWTMWGREGA